MPSYTAGVAAATAVVGYDLFTDEVWARSPMDRILVGAGIAGSAVAGTVVGVSLILLSRHERDKPIPYGPYLAVAGWIALMWGPGITDQYLRASGLL